MYTILQADERFLSLTETSIVFKKEALSWVHALLSGAVHLVQ